MADPIEISVNMVGAAQTEAALQRLKEATQKLADARKKEEESRERGQTALRNQSTLVGITAGAKGLRGSLALSTSDITKAVEEGSKRALREERKQLRNLVGSVAGGYGTDSARAAEQTKNDEKAARNEQKLAAQEQKRAAQELRTLEKDANRERVRLAKETAKVERDAAKEAAAIRKQAAGSRGDYLQTTSGKGIEDAAMEAQGKPSQSGGIGGFLKRNPNVGSAATSVGTAAIVSAKALIQYRDVQRDEVSTEDQKKREFADKWLGGYNPVKFAYDLIDPSRDRDITRVQNQAEALEAGSDVQRGQRSTRFDIETERSRIFARQKATLGFADAGVLGGNPRGLTATQMPNIDRGGIAGQRAFTEAKALLPLREKVVKAERDALEATLFRKSADDKLSELKGKEVEIVARKQKALEQVDKIDRREKDRANEFREGADPQRLIFLNEAQRGERDFQANRLLINKARDVRDDANRGEVGAQGALRGSRLDVQRGNLANLERRTQVAEGEALSLGQLGAGGFQQAKAAFEAYKRVGPEFASADLIAQARVFAPQTVDRQTREFGKTRFAEARAAGATDDYLDDLDAARRNEDKARRGVQAGVAGNERAEAKDLTKVADQLTEKFEDFLTDLLSVLDEKQRELRIGRAARPGG